MFKRLMILAMLLLPIVAFAADAKPKDAFAEVNMKMHHAMMVDPTGDVDIDFVRGMIPHHQGAVDMARIELQQGKDPAIRKLAQDIIAAQKKEIAQMEQWLQQHAPSNVQAPDAVKHDHVM